MGRPGRRQPAAGVVVEVSVDDPAGRDRVKSRQFGRSAGRAGPPGGVPVGRGQRAHGVLRVDEARHGGLVAGQRLDGGGLGGVGGGYGDGAGRGVGMLPGPIRMGGC
jgi:hypothetical protein